MAIYDGDKKDEADKAKQKFPNFNIVVIKDDDIRDKKEKTILGKSGITFDNGKLTHWCLSVRPAKGASYSGLQTSAR